MTPTMERIEQSEKTELAPWEPRISARGHLALVDWNAPEAGRSAEASLDLPRTAGIFPVTRSRAEKLVDCGMAAWMASIVIAVVACMMQI